MEMSDSAQIYQCVRIPMHTGWVQIFGDHEFESLVVYHSLSHKKNMGSLYMPAVAGFPSAVSYTSTHLDYLMMIHYSDKGPSEGLVTCLWWS